MSTFQTFHSRSQDTQHKHHLKTQAGRTLCGNLGFTQQHLQHYIYKHFGTKLQT